MGQGFVTEFAGASSALSVAMILCVRPNTSPAMISGDGLHPFSAP